MNPLNKITVLFSIIFVLALNYNKFAQTKDADVMPSPEGGIMAIAKNVVYPEEAKIAGIQGRVFVEATIDEKGNVTKTSILKGIGYGCDEAAEAAVTKTKFSPATNDGEIVKAVVTIPIQFKLDGEKKK
ncbi:MAG: energy transducer TonB [Ignavibacteriae bacterium]|nr:energy transducer TonB [Ignavibacteriota bacterium]NOG98519.1 energy transducer TonB [Ignavibacteriota bacterium]